MNLPGPVIIHLFKYKANGPHKIPNNISELLTSIINLHITNTNNKVFK